MPISKTLRYGTKTRQRQDFKKTCLEMRHVSRHYSSAVNHLYVTMHRFISLPILFLLCLFSHKINEAINITLPY